jgi:ribosomal protein S6E (S10)
LAKALERSQFYVSAMKKAGYVMQYGTKTTRDHALAWLEANPGFRSSRAYRRKRKAVAA